MLLHLAATYPSSSFVGYDTSARALAVARQHVADRGLGNVTFLNPDDGPEGRLPGMPTYHLVMAQEAIHDTAHPQVGGCQWLLGYAVCMNINMHKGGPSGSEWLLLVGACQLQHRRPPVVNTRKDGAGCRVVMV